MKVYRRLFIILYAISDQTFSHVFDYTMASSVDTLYKREERILTPDEALQKLVQVGISFWNSNTKAVLTYIKDEKSSIQTTLHALSFVQEAINLGQALQQSKILQDFESQYLLAAIVLDKIALLASQLQGKTDAIQFDQEQILILQAQLTDLLDCLQLIKPKLQIKPVDVATNIVVQLAQPQLASTKKLIPALSPVQTIDSFIQTSGNQSSKDYLKSYKFIIQTAHDGNSGYRSVLASNFMHAIDTNQKQSINAIKKLVAENFVHLFMQYDQLFPKNIQPSVAHALEKYLIEQLKKIESYTNLEQVVRLWNEEPVFDFYMITFLKYMLIDYVAKHTKEHAAIIIRSQNLATYTKEMKKWGTQASDLDLTLLAKAIGMSICVQPADTSACTTTYQGQPQLGTSSLLATESPGQYHMLIPKKSSWYSSWYNK